MKKIFLIYFLFTPIIMVAQDSAAYHFTFPDSTYHISDIQIVGNETTKEYIIDHEMSLHRGDLLTYEKLKYDLDRIYSLRLFTKVDADIVPRDDGTASLIMEVNERWYFFPYPLAGWHDHTVSKLYYGLGLTHTNLGGRNVRLLGEFVFGYDPYVLLNYYNPFLNIDNAISLSVTGLYKKQRNRSLVSQGNGANFDENQIAFSVGLGKRYSLFTIIAASVGYLHLTVSDTMSGRTLSSNGTDEYFSFDLSYAYDTRDFKEYPRLGTLLAAGFSKYGILQKEVNYQRFAVDLRRFIPMYFGTVGAVRVFGNAGWGGRIPNYGHLFFGYADRIRGYAKTILEGEQLLGSTAELHIPLLEPRYFRWEAMPIEQFRDIRYAVNLAFFADAGTTWYRNESLALNKTYSGYGVGIHFLFAYSAVGRIEYAFPNGKGNGEIILDLGAAL